MYIEDSVINNLERRDLKERQYSESPYELKIGKIQTMIWEAKLIYQSMLIIFKIRNTSKQLS